MHLIEDSSATESSPPPPIQEQQQQQEQQQMGSNSRGSGRPWDQYDTEDSGVDSVSSVVGLEAENGKGKAVNGSVEYADVIVHRVNNGQQKSFLHNIYGGVVQQQRRQSPQRVESSPTTSSKSNPSIRKNLQKIISKYSGSNSSLCEPKRSVETAKNSFLHSLLDDDESPPPVTSEGLPPPPTLTLDLLPELVQLLDAVQMKNGTVELVGRDGTRASLKVTLTGPVAAVISSPDKIRRKSSFNRIHRNSKRSSQRRKVAPSSSEAVTVPVTNVRRRPSSKKSTQPFTVSVASGTKVATLASKFNSLISEGTTSPPPPPSVSAQSTSGRRSCTPDKPLSPAGRSTTTTKSVSAQSNIRPVTAPPPPPPTRSATVKRNPSSSIKPTIDTIPEIYPLPEGSAEIEEQQPIAPRRRRSGQYPTQPAGVYGTVKSIVKQAIRKFEKLEVTSTSRTIQGEESTGDNCAQSQQSTDYSITNESGTSVKSPMPEGIAPNTSFLWRDQRSMQNLIYEATAFGERTAATAAKETADDATASTYYDTFSREANTYDTLQHLRDRVRSNNDVSVGGAGGGGTTNKSSPSPSTNGYDEIGQPPASDATISPPPCTKSSASSSRRPSDDAMSVKYDDIMKAGGCSLYGGATYDELSFLHSANGGGSVWSVSGGDGGYIHPGSSSTCSSSGTLPGYERILSVASAAASSAALGEDEDGSTLRYEECGDVVLPSPTTKLDAKGKAKAVAVQVREDQLDSISYLYDDIRSGSQRINNNNNNSGCYNGSNYSYEPIYAHLGDSGRRGGRPMSSNSSSASSDTLPGNFVIIFQLPTGGLFQLNTFLLLSLSGSSGSEDGVHEVSSYRLTQLGNGSVQPDSPAPSSEAGTVSIASATRTTATERRSETSDEWIDVSDGDDQPAWTVTRIRQRHEPVNASL